jgi:hypothetical protein
VLEVPDASIIRVVQTSWTTIYVSMIQTVDYKLTKTRYLLKLLTFIAPKTCRLPLDRKNI